MNIINIERAYELLKTRQELSAKINALNDFDVIEIVAKSEYVGDLTILREVGKKRDVRDYLIDKMENLIETIDDELKTL